MGKDAFATDYTFTFSSAGKDFETDPLQATFQPGQSRQSICVVVTDDDIREGTEKFRMVLSIPSSVRAQGVWAGYPYYADVKILGEYMYM